MGDRCVSGHVVRESGPFVSDTSPKCIDREGLKRRRTGTRQDESHFTLETLENMESARERNPIPKKIWQSIQSRNSGNHVTVRPSVRPHHRHTNV